MAADDSARPETDVLPAPRLRAEIGSGYSGYTIVEATANQLRLHTPAEPNLPAITTEIELEDQDWNTFWNELSRIRAWSWDGRRYTTPGVLDGTHWQIEATDGNRTLRAKGSNGYPRSKTAHPSADFKALCRAVSQLAGGHIFS